MGFTPPNPTIGAFHGPDREQNIKNRRDFAKMWETTEKYAREHKWRVKPGSQTQLYIEDGPSKLASTVWVCPSDFERFTIRVTPKRGMLQPALEAMQAAALAQSVPAEADEAIAKRKAGTVRVVQVTTSLFEILGSEPQSADAIERKLAEYVTHFLKALQKA